MMIDKTVRMELSKLAEDHAIDAACLLAVISVESGGCLGKQINGRLEPLIRFEGHYFYRLLGNAKRNKAVVQGLASPTAGRVRNPVRQTARWKLLERASEIDRPAALESCSWGVGQVMGAHWRWLGYGSVDALVADARESISGQVRLMVRFIQKTGLIKKLDNQDWAGFARAYNGPAFHRNRYAQKMRDAFLLYSGSSVKGRISSNPSSRNALPLLRLGSVGDAVSQLQRSLNALGFALSVDGDFGIATERQLIRFQMEAGLKADGICGPISSEAMQRKLPAANSK